MTFYYRKMRNKTSKYFGKNKTFVIAGWFSMNKILEMLKMISELYFVA